MKVYIKFFIIFISIVNLNAQSDISLDSLWSKAKSFSKDAIALTKDYSNQSKNILIEQTVTHSINGLVDNTKININHFDIDDNSNTININLFLKGEDKNLTIDIKQFDWGVTEDKKYIVFENLDINFDIPWIQYVIQDIIKREDGYLKIPHNVAIYSLLYSIKPNIKSTYKEKLKKPFNIVEYPYNTEFIKIERFKSQNNTIDVAVKLKGSKDNLNIIVDSYTLRTANHKKIIVLQDLKFKEFTKPWIRSMIDSQNNEIHLSFTQKLYNILQHKE